MKKFILIILLLISINYLKAQDFFDTDQIQTIEINFAQSNWDDILDTYYSAGPTLRLIGEVLLNGVPYDSVGVRYKGNSSYDANQIKNPFNIKLDFVKGKQEIDGRNVIKLSNVAKDPSFVREVLSYEISRQYMPASASNFVKVTVNGTYIGLYVNDESTNEAFAGRHYFKSNGPFFEGDFSPGAPPTGCPTGAPKVWAYLGTDQACYEQMYAIQTNDPLDWNELINALDTFNNYPAQIEEAFYIDRLLWMIAIDNVLVNLDAPIATPHNFLLYKDGTDRFNPILWDLNQSFGSFKNSGGVTLTDTELKELSPWHNATNANYPILTVPFAEERNEKMYMAKMRTIINENFDGTMFQDRVTELQNIVSTEVQNDPNKFYTNAEFTQNVTSTVQGVIGLNELMTPRLTYLNNHPDIVKVAPEISNRTSSPAQAVSNSTVSISVDVSNANYVHLGYRFSPKDRFIKIPMTNSGGTYTASINLEYADVQYYIWAENDDAGIFSPERAEYEYHSLGVSGDLVINELQASNESIKFDEAAEYDDWIELYNNSDADIDLSGYYLSDNKDSLTKWQIPSQTIASNGYAMFWADKDIIQGMNHTNFQLTRNGESLYLVNPSGNVIDQVTYPYQERDLTYSRFPNGRGAFVIKAATYEASNGDTVISVINNAEEINEVILYPNPSNDKIYLKNLSTQHSFKNADIELFDFTGKLILTKKWSNQAIQELNINQLSKGIYLVKINGNKVQKFVKN